MTTSSAEAAHQGVEREGRYAPAGNAKADRTILETQESFFEQTVRLGTELEVVADFDLTPLLEQFGARVSVLRNSVESGRHTLWLQLDPTERDVDDAVGTYVAMIEALPHHVRALWDRALDRCLNTGVQAGRSPRSYSVELSATSMSLEARISTRHQFTVYAADAGSAKRLPVRT